MTLVSIWFSLFSNNFLSLMCFLVAYKERYIFHHQQGVLQQIYSYFVRHHFDVRGSDQSMLVKNNNMWLNMFINVHFWFIVLLHNFLSSIW